MAPTLNIWRPSDFEIDTMYATANVGVRSSIIDVSESEGCARMHALLRNADVFYANRRHGLSAQALISLTRVSLWLYSLGLFDKSYAHSAARHQPALSISATGENFLQLRYAFRI